MAANYAQLSKDVDSALSSIKDGNTAPDKAASLFLGNGANGATPGREPAPTPACSSATAGTARPART